MEPPGSLLVTLLHASYFIWVYGMHAGSPGMQAGSGGPSAWTKASSPLGLSWGVWAAIIGAAAGALLLTSYCCRSCCPCWAWIIACLRFSRCAAAIHTS